tara:strand:- start:95 stop:268 length:174 start_codon:yes stop_codon:yes gene_type:complete
MKEKERFAWYKKEFQRLIELKKKIDKRVKPTYSEEENSTWIGGWESTPIGKGIYKQK